jgi:outer membrane immunogenic protein
MKKLAITLAAFAALTGTAIAADLPARAPVYKTVPPAPPAMTWTGCYVGAGGGYGMYNQDLTSDTSEFSGVGGNQRLTLGGRGWFGTVQAGCDYQISPSFVIGLFGDYDFASIKGHILDVDEKLSSQWAVGGRVGYVVYPQLLAYFAGGYTQARFDAILAPDCSGCTTAIDAHTYKGWFLGTGYEYGLGWLSPNLFWKTEYRFSSFKKDTLDVLDFCGDGCGGSLNSQKYVQTIRSELVWRFNIGP